MSSRQQKLSPGDLISTRRARAQLRFFYMCDHSEWADVIAIHRDGRVTIGYCRLSTVDHFDETLVVHK